MRPMNPRLFQRIPQMLVLFILAGCASQRVDVKPESQPGQIRYASYTTFWDNLTHHLRTDTLAEEHLEFAEAIRMVEEGRYAEATESLTGVASSADSAIVSAAKSLRDALLLLQQRWQDLAATGDSVIGSALAISEREKYYFEDSSFVVPMPLSATKCPMIDVTINGIRKRFWLDTGAGMTVLSSETAAQCGVIPLSLSQGTAGTATTKTVGFQPASIKQIGLGKLTIRNHPALIIDAKNLRFKLFGLFTLLRIDGIIGWNAIQHLDLTLDYRNKTLRVAKPTVSTLVNRNLIWFNYPILRVNDAAGVAMLFGIDTGANRSSITRSILTKLPDAIYREEERSLGSAGGMEKIRSVRMDELNLHASGYRFRFSQIHSNPVGGTLFVKTDGTLGSDAFQKGRVRIDFTNGLFRYEE